MGKRKIRIAEWTIKHQEIIDEDYGPLDVRDMYEIPQGVSINILELEVDE